MKTWTLGVVALVLGLAACSQDSAEQASPRQQDVEQSASRLEAVSGSFSSLRMYKYVPDNLAPNAPLVVAMHGCTMSARDYEAAGWNDLADLWGFAVLYPEQPGGTNRCFSWWETGQTSRGFGQAAGIKGMIDRMKADHSIDDSRVFVTGLSAGGAMTASMLAAYPDVFSAGAVMAGLPHRCATSQLDGFSCMFEGKNRSAEQWASLVFDTYRGYSGPYPRVSIWHGTGDYTVRDVNAQALVRQWTGVHGVDAVGDNTEQLGGATHTEYLDAQGRPVVESWLIAGMGHGTAVDPGFAPANGCGRAGAFVLDTDLCSTYHAALFFGLAPGSQPPEDPADPTEPVEDPADPVEDPTEPTDPVEEPSDPTDPVEDPADPTDPVEDPADPTDPVEDPSDPADPVEEPEEPSEPTDPVEEPEEPSDPVEEPEEPEEPEAFTCREFNASNYAHTQAERAYVCQGYACARGSDERMGLWNTFYTSWLRETSEGYFEVGRCP